MSTDEAKRMNLLREYGILDTENAPAFDELVELAVQICQVPAGLITFVDQERQWFTSQVGITLPETSRELAFCEYPILDSPVTSIEDATLDPRFCGDALVTGPPYVRFYAGAPLVVAPGLSLGSLAVLDYKPRQLSAVQLSALAVLSRQVVCQLELRRRAAQQHGAADFHGQGVTDRHRAILESALDAIVSMNEAGDIVEFNPAAERIFGYSQAEAIGKPVAELIVPVSLRDRHIRGLRRYLETGEARLIGRRVETTGVRRDGTEFPAELSIQRIGRNDPKLFTGFIRDLSDQKQLETQLRQSQKMEALGQLAGGVAHDFNNLLTVIQGHVALAASAKESDGDWYESLDQIGHAAQRAAGLTRQLLAFSRRQVMQTVRVDLTAIVERATAMLRRVLSESIELTFDRTDNLPAVQADEVMLEQIIVNMAVNARDAMGDVGEIQIRTEVVSRPDHASPELPGAMAGLFVRLSISDTGPGIPPDILPRIFEPFFTTKAAGKGTGLGLSTVFGIVKQHRGWVDVVSEFNQGARFDVYLPAVAGAPETRPAPSRSELSATPASVLLVEDESGVRTVVRRVLVDAGYRVVEAPDGRGALEIWQARHAAFQLLITDLVMPGDVTGAELLKRLLSENPRLRAIVTSGYALELDIPHALQERISVLPKPYVPDQLLAAVRQTLGAC